MTPFDPANPPGLPNLSLDFAFLRRVYITSVVCAVLLAPVVWQRFYYPAGFGFILGVVLSLAMLMSLDWTVRRILAPGNSSAAPMVWVGALKVVLAAGILGLAYLAALQKWLNVLWILPGFMLPHLVFLMKLLGKKLTGSKQRLP